MATVFELSEPYRNYLVPVLPSGRSVCTVCWTAVDPAYSLCYQCYIARGAYSRRRLADVVVPVALAVKREQIAHELWHYKYDTDATVRRRLETRLAAVFWRFLGQHESHIADAAAAATIAVAVIGRHFDRAFGPGETYYQQARKRKFTWEQCCLEYHTDDTPDQLSGRAARWDGAQRH